jgi:hypothetical protein
VILGPEAVEQRSDHPVGPGAAQPGPNEPVTSSPAGS